MKATDIDRLVSLSAPSLDPSGSVVVAAASHPDLASDQAVGQLWSAPVDGTSPPRRLTRGIRDTAPRFSPDGSLIGFLRSAPGERAQLHLIPADGGEAVAVTDAPLGVESFRFSPDGSRIAFLARAPERGRYGTVEGRDAAAESPRRITTLKYKSNGVGYTIDRRTQAFVVDVPDVRAEPRYEAAPTSDGSAEAAPTTPEARQLTSGDADHAALEWSVDGESVLVVAALHESRDVDLRRAAYAVPVAGGEPHPLTSGDLAVSHAVQDADGALWFLAQELGPSGRDFVGASTSLYLSRDGDARRLTDPLTVDLGDPGSSVTLTPDGAALVQQRTRGAVQLLRVASDGPTAVLTRGAVEVVGQDAVGATVVVSAATADSAGELIVLEPGGPRAISDFGRGIRDAGVVPLLDLVVPARDGGEVHGWVAAPTGGGPHPVLLSIHGGPFAQYTSTLFDEAQVYVDAGYAVVFCNPRGSAGYGHAHGRAIRQAMGTVDLTDVLDFLEGALEAQPSLDAARVGVMGGSYGGYLTAWAIAHDHRFAGAIVERGFLDPDSFVGSSDIGSFFGQEYVGTDPDLVRAQSPQAVAGAVRTPTLVLHSADDLRCPLGQAERYFATLKANGVEAELLVFPAENHELSRSGRPRHRVERFDAILEWWSRHLPVGPRP